MRNEDMIQGDLFDLKGKERWKALGQRLWFVFTDIYVWVIFGGICYIVYLFNLLN